MRHPLAGEAAALPGAVGVSSWPGFASRSRALPNSGPALPGPVASGGCHSRTRCSRVCRLLALRLEAHTHPPGCSSCSLDGTLIATTAAPWVCGTSRTAQGQGGEGPRECSSLDTRRASAGAEPPPSPSSAPPPSPRPDPQAPLMAPAQPLSRVACPRAPPPPPPPRTPVAQLCPPPLCERPRRPRLGSSPVPQQMQLPRRRGAGWPAARAALHGGHSSHPP